MENESPNLENQSINKKNKSTCLIISLVLLVVVIAAVVLSALLILNSPKIKARILILRAASLNSIFDNTGISQNMASIYENEENEAESMSSETTIDLNDLSLPGVLEYSFELKDLLNIKTEYDQRSESSEINLTAELEDMEIFSSDIFLDSEDLILKSDYLYNTYVVNIAQMSTDYSMAGEQELGEEGKVISEAITNFGKQFLIDFPYDYVDKGTKSIEILHEEKDVKYLEFSLNQEEFRAMVGQMQEDIKSNQSLEDALDKIVEDFIEQNGEQFSQSMGIELLPEDIDFYELILSLLGDVKSEDLGDYHMTIYYENLKPIAYQFDIKNGLEVQFVIKMAANNEGNQFSIYFDIDGDSIAFDFYSIDQQTSYDFAFNLIDTGDFEFTSNFDFSEQETTQFNMNIRYVDYIEDFEAFMDMEGDMTHTETEESFNFLMSLYDESYQAMKIEIGTTKEITDEKTSQNMMINSIFDESVFVDIASASETVNKENGSETQGTLNIDFYADGQEGSMEIGFENLVQAKDTVKVTMPTYNKNDKDVVYYSGQSNPQELEKFLMTLQQDFEDYLYYLGL